MTVSFTVWLASGTVTALGETGICSSIAVVLHKDWVGFIVALRRKTVKDQN